jgi:hypothetical protein
LQAFHEGIFRLRNVTQATCTLINDTDPMILGGLGRRSVDGRRLAGGALAL